MPAPRKPDRLRQEAAAQAAQLRLQRQATVDAKVRRAHEGGATDSDMVRDLRLGAEGVKASRERQGLTANRDALFGGAKRTKDTKAAAKGRET